MARSPDRAITGLVTSGTGDLRSARWHGRETVPQRGVYPAVPQSAVLGDCRHRFYVRMLEVMQSVDLVRQAMDRYSLAKGSHGEPVKLAEKLPKGGSVSRNRSPQRPTGLLHRQRGRVHPLARPRPQQLLQQPLRGPGIHCYGTVSRPCHNVSIALPALECGLGGLEWSSVGPLICRYLHGIGIDVAIYLPRERLIDRKFCRRNICSELRSAPKRHREITSPANPPQTTRSARPNRAIAPPSPSPPVPPAPSRASGGR